MWKYAVLFSLLFAYSEGATTKGPDIVDGVKAGETDRPYQVSLKAIFLHFCGGTIINEYWVVTAAHCTIQFNSTMVGFLFVAVGMLDVSQPGQNHKVDKMFEHEKYDAKDSWRNDIALVKVREPFTFNSRVQPATLPKPHLAVPDNSSVVVSGWGYLGGKDNISPRYLQEVTVYAVSLERCRKLIETPGSDSKVYDTNVCAYNSEKRAGECTNDSGGPLTYNGTLVRLVSWSYKDPYCASTEKPSLYTRVSEYLDWIKEHTA